MASRFSTPQEWMDGCFGKNDPELRERCDCPPSCKELCMSTKHSKRYSPISMPNQGQTKPYTKIYNGLLLPWEHEELGDPPAITKLIYFFLLSFTRNDRRREDTRWINRRIDVLAEQFFGTDSKAKRRTFGDHLRKLEDYGMISLIPFKDVDPGHKSGGGIEKSIIINDLPIWWLARDDFRENRPTRELICFLDVEDDRDILSDREIRDRTSSDTVFGEPTDEQIAAMSRALEEGREQDRKLARKRKLERKKEKKKRKKKSTH
jgi:hypothetical protein